MQTQKNSKGRALERKCVYCGDVTNNLCTKCGVNLCPFLKRTKRGGNKEKPTMCFVNYHNVYHFGLAHNNYIFWDKKKGRTTKWIEPTEEVEENFKDYIKRLLLHYDEVQCVECTTATATTDANTSNINDGNDKQQNTINECSGSNNTNTGTIVE